MDLNKYDTRAGSERGTDMQLVFEGTPLVDEASGEPVTLHVLGPDSEAYRKAEALMQAGKANAVIEKGKKFRFAEGDIQETRLKLALAVITGWSHIEVDGKVLEFSKESARTLLQRFPWIVDQVHETLSSREAFLGN